MTIGMNSNVTDFDRKKLNLVILLDISGSMNGTFGDGASQVSFSNFEIFFFFEILFKLKNNK